MSVVMPMIVLVIMRLNRGRCRRTGGWDHAARASRLADPVYRGSTMRMFVIVRVVVPMLVLVVVPMVR